MESGAQQERRVACSVRCSHRKKKTLSTTMCMSASSEAPLGKTGRRTHRTPRCARNNVCVPQKGSFSVRVTGHIVLRVFGLRPISTSLWVFCPLSYSRGSSCLWPPHYGWSCSCFIFFSLPLSAARTHKTPLPGVNAGPAVQDMPIRLPSENFDFDR